MFGPNLMTSVAREIWAMTPAPFHGHGKQQGIHHPQENGRHGEENHAMEVMEVGSPTEENEQEKEREREKEKEGKEENESPISGLSEVETSPEHSRTSHQASTKTATSSMVETPKVAEGMSWKGSGWIRCDVRKSWREGAVGEERTVYAGDKTWLFWEVVRRDCAGGTCPPQRFTSSSFGSSSSRRYALLLFQRC